MFRANGGKVLRTKVVVAKTVRTKVVRRKVVDRALQKVQSNLGCKPFLVTVIHF
jgi:hypothetical protein